MKTYKLLLSMLLIYLIAYSSSSYAYNSIANANGTFTGGHPELTNWSIQLLQVQNELLLTGIDLGRLRSGNHHEDDGANPLHHFYNPGNGQGLMGIFPSALTYADSYFQSAIDDFVFGIRGSASEYLGRTLHLLQDMAVPAHALGLSHMNHSFKKIGYEWWITNHWSDYNYHLSRILSIPQFNYIIEAGNIKGYMEAMATQSAFGGYNADFDGKPLTFDSDTIITRVEGYEADYTAKMLLPMAVRVGGGLIKTFCKRVNCTGLPTPAPNNSGPGGGNPDDNFDVSSRLIKLEELDVTKQSWKDLYGRTGIKKGYSGLFLEKAASEAYGGVKGSALENRKV